MDKDREALPVLAARGLSVALRNGGAWASGQSRVVVHSLDVSVSRGETLAIVGESGCGKTVTALALNGLLPPGAAITTGTVELHGQPVSGLPEGELRRLRGDRIGMIFQDPMTALNPVLTIGEQIEEAILAHRPIGRASARARAEELLVRVKLSHPRRRLGEYPHQLSGGMRQRVMIAIAISNEPDVLIADEPTTALDATVQAEILSLLADIQAASGMALVLITHDLGVVARWAQRVLVMYAGRKVEERPTVELLGKPLHPYTRALMRARPSRRPAHGRRHRLAEIPGTVPVVGAVQTGCAFRSRCESATGHCDIALPVVRWVNGNDKSKGAVACHHATGAPVLAESEE